MANKANNAPHVFRLSPATGNCLDCAGPAAEPLHHIGNINPHGVDPLFTPVPVAVAGTPGGSIIITIDVDEPLDARLQADDIYAIFLCIMEDEGENGRFGLPGQWTGRYSWTQGNNPSKVLRTLLLEACELMPLGTTKRAEWLSRATKALYSPEVI